MTEEEAEFLKGQIEGALMCFALTTTLLVQDLGFRKKFAEVIENALSDLPDENIFVGRPHFRAGASNVFETFRERIATLFPDELN